MERRKIFSDKKRPRVGGVFLLLGVLVLKAEPALRFFAGAATEAFQLLGHAPSYVPGVLAESVALVVRATAHWIARIVRHVHVSLVARRPTKLN